jgi:hypothetical protein
MAWVPPLLLICDLSATGRATIRLWTATAATNSLFLALAKNRNSRKPSSAAIIARLICDYSMSFDPSAWPLAIVAAPADFVWTKDQASCRLEFCLAIWTLGAPEDDRANPTYWAIDLALQFNPKAV